MPEYKNNKPKTSETVMVIGRSLPSQGLSRITDDRADVAGW